MTATGKPGRQVTAMKPKPENDFTTDKCHHGEVGADIGLLCAPLGEFFVFL